MGTITEDKDGNPIIASAGQIVIDGEVDKSKALKVARKENPSVDNLVITKTETKTELRGMPVSDFIANSILMADPRTPQPPVVDLTTPKA